MHKQIIRVGIVSGLAMAALLITMVFIADGRPSNPFAARSVYAASRTFCVNLAGGQTHAPCANRTAYTTIQAAVDASRTGDEIRIAKGTYTTSHPGYAVVIIGAKSLVLWGGFDGFNWSAPTPGAMTAIDGQGAVRGIEISGYIVVVIETLTVMNGNAPRFESSVYNGGGIYAPDGLLVLIDGHITNNTASSEGGGVYTASAIVRDTAFVGNSAEGRAGGLYASLVDVDGGMFEGNSAGDTSDGGGVCVIQDGAISRTQFISNAAGFTGGGLFIGNTATLTDTIVIGNHAGYNGGGLYQGYGADGRVNITRGIFERNTAEQYNGGGLLAWGSLFLTDTQVISNTAGDRGGGLFQNMPAGQVRAVGSSFERNVATNNGGGLFVTGNLALLGVSIAENSSGASGGGIFQSNVYNGPARVGQLKIVAGVIEGNQAAGTGGGLSVEGSAALDLRWMRVISNTAGVDGGGLYLPAAQTLQLTGALLADNRAVNSADGLYVSGKTNLLNVTIASALLSPHAAIQSADPADTFSLINTAVTSHTIGIVRAAGSTLTGDYNAFFGNGTNQTVGGAASPLSFVHTVGVNPQFVKPSNHDFHLRVGSPLVNAGDPSRNYSGQRDMDGEGVPVEGRADIGADELYKYRIYLPLIQR